jgi:hypothetical protein
LRVTTAASNFYPHVGQGKSIFPHIFFKAALACVRLSPALILNVLETDTRSRRPGEFTGIYTALPVVCGLPFEAAARIHQFLFAGTRGLLGVYQGQAL